MKPFVLTLFSETPDGMNIDEYVNSSDDFLRVDTAAANGKALI
jgi:hypothetical protein